MKFRRVERNEYLKSYFRLFWKIECRAAGDESTHEAVQITDRSEGAQAA